LLLVAQRRLRLSHQSLLPHATIHVSRTQTSGLDRNINHWQAVNDFLWIKPNQQSPNWSILPEAER
jgi:hypothetical protein